jgi:trimeric autotransporter adhesin
LEHIPYLVVAVQETTIQGWEATLSSNGLTGSFNIGVGSYALRSMTSGSSNIGIGNNALPKATTISWNIAIGDSTLFNYNGADPNIAIGKGAMKNMGSTSGFNTALGFEAMTSANGGSDYNTVMGYRSGRTISTGNRNVLLGANAGALLTSSSYNTVAGAFALSNHTGYSNGYNVAIGYEALLNSNPVSTTTARYNTAVGSRAMVNNLTGANNTALGAFSAENGNHSNSTFLGYRVNILTGRNNIIAIGANITDGQITGDGQMALGNTGISQILAVPSGFTSYSDARFKTNVANDVKGLDFITRLNPVSYNIDPAQLHLIWGTPEAELLEIDHTVHNNRRYIGLLAQDVELAASAAGYSFPGLEVPADSLQAYRLRYTDLVMPLIQSIKEQQAQIESQEATIRSLQDKLLQLETENAEFNILLQQILEKLN